MLGAQISSTGGAPISSDLVTNQTAATQFIVSNELNQQLQQQQQQQTQQPNPRSLLTNSALLAAAANTSVDSKPVITITPGKDLRLLLCEAIEIVDCFLKFRDFALSKF